MTKPLTFILGGARSGKSRYAEQLAAERGKRILYVATAEAWDEEMRARIAAHKAQRPADWTTLEAPTQTGELILSHLQAGLQPEIDLVLVDCLTLLAANLIAPLPEPYNEATATAALMPAIESLLRTYQQSNAAWILVSNEVGLGVVPPYPLGRAYRDALGRANQRLAALADQVYFMVAGLPMKVK